MFFLPTDLLMEHIQEIRTLRNCLEESIKTNEKLRKQLERQGSETDQGKEGLSQGKECGGVDCCCVMCLPEEALCEAGGTEKLACLWEPKLAHCRGIHRDFKGEKKRILFSPIMDHKLSAFLSQANISCHPTTVCFKGNGLP